MQASACAAPLLGEPHGATAAVNGFDVSFPRSVERTGDPREEQPHRLHPLQDQERLHLQTRQQQQQNLQKHWVQERLAISRDASKCFQQCNVNTEDDRRNLQLFRVLPEQCSTQQRPIPPTDLPQDRETPPPRQQDLKQTSEPGDQQSRIDVASKNSGCNSLKLEGAALRRWEEEHDPSRPSPTTLFERGAAAASTILTEIKSSDSPTPSPGNYMQREIYVSQDLPIIYTHSMAFQEALPVGRLIPENVRPPQSKVAAGLGPVKMPPVLIGSPFFHCAPSSPQCPPVNLHTPALAALPQPLVATEEPFDPSPAYSPSVITSCVHGICQATTECAALRNLSSSVAAPNPGGRNGIASRGSARNVQKENLETVVSCARYQMMQPTLAFPAVGVRGSFSNNPPVTGAVKTTSPRFSEAATAVCQAPSGGTGDCLGHFSAAVDAVSSTGAAGLLDAGSDPAVTDPSLDVAREDQRQQEQSPHEASHRQRRGLKMITVPHQHASLYNHTVAALKKRLEESGQLSAIYPSGLYLHEQLQSRSQPAFFSFLKEVNRNAADAASLSQRWQEGYSSTCVSLPATVVAKLKALEQKKEKQLEQSPSASSNGSRHLSTSSSLSSSFFAAETAALEDKKAFTLQKIGPTENEGSQLGSNQKDEEETPPVITASPSFADLTPIALSSAVTQRAMSGLTKPLASITIEDLIIQPGPPPSAARILSNLALATAAAGIARDQEQEQQQPGRQDNQLLSGVDAAESHRFPPGCITVQEQQLEQQHFDCERVALQLSELPDYSAANSSTYGPQASSGADIAPGSSRQIQGGAVMVQSNVATESPKEDTREIATNGKDPSRICMLQQQLEVQERKVKYLERMLAQHRAAYLATRPYNVKPLLVGSGRMSYSCNRPDCFNSTGHTCGRSGSRGGEDATAEVQERQNGENWNSRKSSGAGTEVLKEDREGENIGSRINAGKNEKVRRKCENSRRYTG